MSTSEHTKENPTVYIRACYNACREAGIEDPEVAIPKMREDQDRLVKALEIISNEPDAYNPGRKADNGYTEALVHCANIAREALAMAGRERWV